METDPFQVPTKPRLNMSEALRSMQVGDTLRFPPGCNYASLRTLATTLGIRVSMRFDEGIIEVTRRPDKPVSTAVTKDKLYDL